MASILVRNLDDQFVHRLKESAKRNGRSLQSEAKQILANGLRMTMFEAFRVSTHWHKRLTGRKFSDSTQSVREDRDR